MNKQDLTRGSVAKTITLFALPMLLGNLFQQAYNVVDTWVVGQYVSADALAGVGSSFSLMVFLTSILLGLCMGSGVVFSVAFGRKDMQHLSRSIGTAFYLIACIAVLLTAIPLFLLPNILRWLNIPSEIALLTHDYMFIVFWGIPAVFAYNFFSAYMKAVGNSVVPLVFLGISTLLNIALDLLFVVVFSFGASGAAAATVIAQYTCGTAICIYALRKDTLLRSALMHTRPTADGLREIASYSVFTCLQQSVMNLGILMVQGIVNGFGTTVMAAFAAAVKIDAFAYMPAQEYANAFSTFTAQNMGAGQYDRVHRGIRCAVTASMLYCAAASIVLWLLAPNLMSAFVGRTETAVIAEGVRYLRIEGAFYCGIGLLFLLYGLYRAIGKPELSLVLTIISLGTRVALAYWLSPIASIGVSGIWWAVPIGWGLADAFGIGYWYTHASNAEPLPSRR